MSLIDRIFKGGKDKGAPPATERASTQFYESEPDSEDLQAQRSAPRRELVQVVLRDAMRKHGIPSDWIECRILSAVTRSGRRGMHVNFVVREAHEQLLGYVFSFQESFYRELTRFEPRCRDWLLSVGWEFPGAKAAEMPEAQNWLSGRPSGVGAASAPAPLTAVPPASTAAADEAARRGEDEVQHDLKALFAIRDAAMAQTAARGSREDGHRDFEPTQPFDDDK